MADPITWGVVGGVGLSAYGQIKGAQDEAEAAEKDAEFKRQQANEVEYKAARNEELIAEEGEKLEGQAISAFAASGFDIAGSPLMALESMAHQVRRDIHAVRHEARFRAGQLRAGANIGMDLASDRQTAGYLGAGGTVLTGLARSAELNRSPKEPTPAPTTGKKS